MKKPYEEPEISIELFTDQDILTNSWGGEGGGDEPDEPIDW